MKEETSYRVKKIYDNSIFDTFVRTGENQFVHHFFALYDVELENANKTVDCKIKLNTWQK
ncbi:Protein of unknown function [Lactobacillus gigeriorum DSM 23908 = CRBIP 24.85]|uniref:Uncharacterized protein n=1 Tax=Lactobacillus gigeriorum DSM 23908 = CRBIP 24.85 TaxID=1423751 RepID=I7LGK5_9LACO|nr:Protein of unknown function [Lactobacillus gigeriorum DSM 23908 = CRBIP 24.85]